MTYTDTLDYYFVFNPHDTYVSAVKLANYPNSFWNTATSVVERGIKAYELLRRIEANELATYYGTKTIRWSKNVREALETHVAMLTQCLDDDLKTSHLNEDMSFSEYVQRRLSDYQGEQHNVYIEWLAKDLGHSGEYVWHNNTFVRVFPVEWEYVESYEDNGNDVLITEVSPKYHHHAKNLRGYAQVDFYALKDGKCVRVRFGQHWIPTLTLRLADGEAARVLASLTVKYPPVVAQKVDTYRDVAAFSMPLYTHKNLMFQRLVVFNKQTMTVSSFWNLFVPND